MITRKDIKLAVTENEAGLDFSRGIDYRFLKQISTPCVLVTHSNEVTNLIIQIRLQCKNILDQALCFIQWLHIIQIYSESGYMYFLNQVMSCS